MTENQLTNREVSCLSWNTMYPERRSYKDLEESTKVEWEKFISIVRDALAIENDTQIYLIKEKLKDQL